MSSPPDDFSSNAGLVTMPEIFTSKSTTASATSYSTTVLQHWDHYKFYLQNEQCALAVNGTNVDLGFIVAVARNGANVEVDESILANLDKGHAALEKSLANGDIIYGVNTGFGGSANTRTDNVYSLQQSLVRMLNSGVIFPNLHQPRQTSISTSSFEKRLKTGLNTDDLNNLNCMPVPWVRAALLTRINSLVAGHSGVRGEIVERMLQLLRLDIVPRIPMHGSISASGDLSPLSYIGSTLQGKGSVTVTVGALSGNPQIMTARDALTQHDLKPKKLIAKEALAIVNGTAVSGAVAALALHEAHGLTVLAHVLTAMSVEALNGSSESFDPFFARVRPHRGQADCAQSIFGYLQGSKLVDTGDTDASGVLKQDRYSIRTASQWLGPVLEDLLLAHEQIFTECNSVTDNPLIDMSESPPRYMHGGNFQAKAVTSAIEKVRQSLQTIGRLLFTQSTELVNPATSRGLSPNLTADDPSESFPMKGVDILVAALLSELGFLANPVGSHVQSAEMGNQALNSLALISARYTLTAVDVTSKLAAAHMLVACQALDLRVMNTIFFDNIRPQIERLAELWLRATSSKSVSFSQDVLSHIRKQFDDTVHQDSSVRFDNIAKATQQLFLDTIPASTTSITVSQIQALTKDLAKILRECYTATCAAYRASPDATPYLGLAARRMYMYIRETLSVPFLTEDVLRGPKKPVVNGNDTQNTVPSEDEDEQDEGATPPTIGAYVTTIYTSIRSGELYAPAMEALKEVHGI